jgi:glycosyltransferase involved in cell wall biosynthesis
MKLVSVIIPHKARRKILCLESVYRQTYSNIQVIVETDIFGSGASKTRNDGFDKSIGEYLFFCDDDICLNLDCIEKMAKVLDENEQVSFVYCNYSKYGLLNGIESSMPWDFEQLKIRNYISTMSMVRRNSFCRFDETLDRYQDWDLWLTIAERGEVGFYLDKVLFSAFYEEGGISIRGKSDRITSTKILKDKHRIGENLYSIIIPVRNGLERLKECIYSVNKMTFGNQEIIIVDDGSDLETKGYLKSLLDSTNIILLEDKNRLHHTGAVNLGVSVAKGNILCILNSDILVSRYWNSILSAIFNIYTNASCVGPMTSKAASIQQVRDQSFYKVQNIYKELDYGVEKFITSCNDGIKKMYKAKTITAKITGFCFITTRNRWDEIGELDPDIPAGGNEAEWIIRGLKREIFPKVRTDVYVHHYGNESYKAEDRSGLWELGRNFIVAKHGQRALDLLENEMYRDLVKKTDKKRKKLSQLDEFLLSKIKKEPK